MFLPRWIRKIIDRKLRRSLEMHPTELLYHALDEMSAKLKVLDRGGRLDEKETQALYREQVKIMSELYQRRRALEKLSSKD
jgi:hypothetical protein